MTDHLSTLQVKQLCASALPEDELAAAVAHTAECQPCQQRFVEELRRQRGSAPSNFSLEPEFWFRHDHIDFDQLVALADKTLDQETEEIINFHLKTCETCREDVRSLLAFRKVTAREMDIPYGSPDYKSSHKEMAPSWWHSLPWKPVYAAYAVVAIVLLAVAVLIGVNALNKRSGPLEAKNQNQTNPIFERSPGVSSSPNVTPSPSSVAEVATLAILKDAGGELTINKDGRVTGLDDVSAIGRQYVARAVLSERIEPPDVLRHLSGDQSGLRSNDDGPQRFRLLYPVRSVVIEDRPIFRWERLPRVSSYRVYVLDGNGNQVGQSDELHPGQTQWKAPTPLHRGQIFSWVVIAVIDGKQVVSPSASAPEMKFAVLSTADFQELSRLQKSNSHLALGVFYARVGLLNDAEREFQSLIKLNPDSELPRKLLQTVRSIN